MGLRVLGYLRRSLATRSYTSLVVVGLVCMIACHSIYAGELEPNASTSFDTFIDKTTGEEAPQTDVIAQKAYRGKRVYKSIFKWIDRQGYYSDFINQFQNWCAANSGRYVRNNGLDADCFAKTNDLRLGSYNVQIVSTATHDGNMTAGHATFYFFRQQELGAIVNDQLERDNRARQLAETRQTARIKEESAQRQQAILNLPIVSKVGQKICRTLNGLNQPTTYFVGGAQVRPEYLLTAFTEGSANNRIQVRIAAIRAKLPTGLANVDRLEGDVVIQVNSILWEDPLLWQQCN